MFLGEQNLTVVIDGYFEDFRAGKGVIIAISLFFFLVHFFIEQLRQEDKQEEKKTVFYLCKL
ncbi:hypothetical protein QQP08_003215 [Theobroma cacao]|nr:hypothetical protein QQP08_003215 [Theobroma cacao]